LHNSLITSALYSGTNLILGKNAPFHGEFLKMCPISLKIQFEKFTKISRALSDLSWRFFYNC